MLLTFQVSSIENYVTVTLRLTTPHATQTRECVKAVILGACKQSYVVHVFTARIDAFSSRRAHGEHFSAAIASRFDKGDRLSGGS